MTVITRYGRGPGPQMIAAAAVLFAARGNEGPVMSPKKVVLTTARPRAPACHGRVGGWGRKARFGTKFDWRGGSARRNEARAYGRRLLFGGRRGLQTGRRP